MLWLCVNNHYYLVRWTLNPKRNMVIAIAAARSSVIWKWEKQMFFSLL